MSPKAEIVGTPKRGGGCKCLRRVEHSAMGPSGSQGLIWCMGSPIMQPGMGSVKAQGKDPDWDLSRTCHPQVS